MKHLTSEEFRKVWSDFWESKQHINLPEVSLIADKESTALFNVAGMQPLIPYLMGKEHPLGKRIFNIQKCIRTVDIAEVGDSSHLTFFEMMGNWSLGEYFKKEAVGWSWEFLTKYLEMDPRKIAVTVFAGDENAPRDEETAIYWKECFEQAKIPANISYLPAKNNRRSPGPVGPCGPDTEIFYRVGESEFPPDESTVENDEDNWLEIWNNVFMEYYRDESGSLSKLSKQNVDTGMGFERMCSVLQQKKTVYETDLFFPAIQTVEKITKLAYIDHQRRFRIIVDHARTAFMLINDGLVPSNMGAGYVLRMIIRRLIYNAVLLHQDFSNNQVINGLFTELLHSFKSLRVFNESEILRILQEESTIFGKTLQNGMQILTSLITQIKQENKTELDGKDIFKLYDTYGFPLELTREIAQEHGLCLDEEGCQCCIQEAKEKSRQATQDMFKKGIDWSKYLEGMPQTEFIGYDTLSCTTPTLLKEISIDGKRVLIFDKTPFYPEMGGQKGDTGSIKMDDGKIVEIEQVQKFAGVILHFAKE